MKQWYSLKELWKLDTKSIAIKIADILMQN